MGAFVYGGHTALFFCAVLGVLEISLSFDNAVINATVLERMSPFWQRIFLTVGIVIAVFGMRLVFPLLIVAVTAGLGPVEAISLAMEQRPESNPTSYAALLADAHPQIAAFGGMFLLMLFLDFVLTEREITWLSWIERPLATIGRLDQLSVVVAVGALLICAETLAEEPDVVLPAGMLGLVGYLAVNGLSALFEQPTPAEPVPGGTRPTPVIVVGRAAFFLFLYLEVLDASFSFDGVIGAFAITSDPILIALGLGLIGAMFVRSLTVFFVRNGTLADYVYLEHGAHWAIGALAVILLLSFGIELDEVFTGLIGVVLIAAAFGSSVLRNRRLARGVVPA
nr:DUF475 domain-containing protein [Nakamurella deserti]